MAACGCGRAGGALAAADSTVPCRPIRFSPSAVTVQLWECIRSGTVCQHPLFRVTATDTGSGGASAQLPAVGAGSGYQRYGGEGSV